MPAVTVHEAADKLNVSELTIRRRLHKGLLKGYQEDPPHGRWWVELAEDVPGKQYEDGDKALEALNGVIDMLRVELDAKNEQIRELHVLLQQAQAALPAPGRSWWRFWRG